ncbi:MAG: hypothetical protein MK132_16040 [Lentisphaerales bacterium]|nr:hypothetical protein [Lentisphaerales bacterium]
MSHFKMWFLAIVTAANILAADLTLAQKLQLKVSSIKLKDATLNQAIETLRRHAREIDPDKRGINIIVKQNDLPANEMKINLDLTNVPLQDAIKYIAKSVGLSMSVSPQVVLISKTSLTHMTTKFYRVSNSFKSFVNPKNPVVITKKHLTDFFEITGLNFPKGSSIAYIAGKNMLSITNTLDNHDKARKALISLNCLR